jgi:Predicted Permease Membrane Region
MNWLLDLYKSDPTAQGPGLAGVCVTAVPLLAVGAVAIAVRKLDFAIVSGLLAGSMTDPPAPAFATGVCASDAPMTTYAAVYPLTTLLRRQSAAWPGRARLTGSLRFRLRPSSVQNPAGSREFCGRTMLQGEDSLRQKSGWRREWDSNPRYPFEVHALSRRVPSAARPSLRAPAASREPHPVDSMAEREGFEPSIRFWRMQV